MTQLTIDVPAHLAIRLQSLQDRLVEILEIGMEQLDLTENILYDEVVEFLGSGPSPEEIVALHPSALTQERIGELLDKNRTGTLTAVESKELDEYRQLNHLMTQIKLRARQHLSQ
jgi:hypothetical protein